MAHIDYYYKNYIQMYNSCEAHRWELIVRGSRVKESQATTRSNKMKFPLSLVHLTKAHILIYFFIGVQ